MTLTVGDMPRENLFRARYPAIELRDAEDEDGDGRTLVGHFAVFNEWTEINSLWEGNFLERFAPGSFKKTFREQRDRMRVLFQHGFDPQVGDKPLGPIDVLMEDSTGERTGKSGAYYEVPLLDTSYNRDLQPGLEAGLYGASFRFRTMREELVEEPAVSEHNPHGLPERTIKEAQVMEFGPVTFPAYDGATAGVRSLTDVFAVERFMRDPQRMRELIDAAPKRTDEPAPKLELELEKPEQEPTPAAATRPARASYLTTGAFEPRPNWRL